jgi:hypothetical protein
MNRFKTNSEPVQNKQRRAALRRRMDGAKHVCGAGDIVDYARIVNVGVDALGYAC